MFFVQVRFDEFDDILLIVVAAAPTPPHHTDSMKTAMHLLLLLCYRARATSYALLCNANKHMTLTNVIRA